MTTTATLEARVRAVVVDELGVDEDEVVASASLIGDLGADEVGVVELVMALEMRFEIEIPEEEADRITTFGDLVTAVGRQLS